MLLIRLLLLAAVFFSVSAARAGKVEYVEGKLDNGLTYHIFNVPSADRRLTLRLQVEAGAADEESGEEGIAHITEHMVFQSSASFPQGLGTYLNKEGWQIGRHYNAQTGYRFTRYLLAPPQGRRQLEEALAVYRQILSPQNFSPDDWAKEQQVILAEWRQQQTLANRLGRQHHALLHSGSRSGRYAPIGSRAAIEQAEADTASRFHGKWYGSNNAVLVIIGDVNPKKAAHAVKEVLGRLKPAALPIRNAEEYEPKPVGKQVQYVTDKDNTDNSLSLVYRFGNAASQENSDGGLYHRLLDNFAAHIINTRLQSEGQNISMKFGNIGMKTGSLVFHTDDVQPGGQQQALALLERFVGNIKAQPASDDETAAYRKVLHNHLSSKESLPDDLPKIIQLADENLLAGKNIPSPALRAAERGQLYRINTRAVNRRISEWLDAEDRLIIMQTEAEPQDKPVSEVSVADKTVKPLPAKQSRLKMRTAAEPAGMPVKSSGAQNTVFPPHQGQGTVVSKRYDKENAVTYFKLSNGDHIVFLHHAVAGGNIYFKAVADTGYLHNGVNGWQAQLAAEIVNRAAPEGWSGHAFRHWQQQQGIRYRYRLDSDRQTVDAHVAEAGLEKLLQLYRSRQTAPAADWPAELEAAAVRLPVYLQSVPGRQEQELEILRYGQTEARPLNSAEIRAVTPQDMIRQWRKLASGTVNYYIVGSMPSEKIIPVLTQYLADIPRSHAENLDRPLSEGATLRRARINDTDGTDVNAWSWQPFYDWTPDTSEQIPLLVNLANARLKDELRSRSQNTYSVKFAAWPQPAYNRVESNLFFSTQPEKAAEAWEAAQQIMLRLPENITKAEADNLQQLFIEQEAKRRTNPEIWLERLAASHRHYGDARYLSRLPQLHRGIIQTRLRQTAKLLWSTQNARVLLADPARRQE